MASNESIQKYFDSLLATYDILTEALEKASERGLKVSKAFASDVIAGQREAIELGRRLASEPTDAGQFYTAVLEATTAAQSRALAFAQQNFQEALAASTETRETMEKLVAANRQTAEAALAAARTWAGSNPMADALKRGFEMMNPQRAESSRAAAGNGSKK